MAVVRRKDTQYYKTRSISTLSKTGSRPISRAYTESTKLTKDKNLSLSLNLIKANLL